MMIMNIQCQTSIIQYIEFSFDLFDYNMSHFISGVDLQGVLVFHQMPTDIVKPKIIRKYVDSKSSEQIFDKKVQGKIMDHICKRFSKIQQNQLNIQREIFIHQKCQTLKRKFKSAFNPKADGKSVQNFFTRDNISMQQQMTQVSSSLGYFTRQIQPKIQLQKKYNSTIKIKMMLIQQAKMINKQKQQYKFWLNKNNNCNQSPNLNKMMFLFERLSKQSQINHGCGSGSGMRKMHKYVKTQPNFREITLGIKEEEYGNSGGNVGNCYGNVNNVKINVKEVLNFKESINTQSSTFLKQNTLQGGMSTKTTYRKKLRKKQPFTNLPTSTSPTNHSIIYCKDNLNITPRPSDNGTVKRQEYSSFLSNLSRL